MATTPAQARLGQPPFADAPPWKWGNRLIGYDPDLKRVWIGGQRLHHGATGIALAGTALAQLVVGNRPARRGLPWFLAAGAMVAHDWKDRSVWFQRGPQSDDEQTS
jgi:hypothetical protein